MQNSSIYRFRREDAIPLKGFFDYASRNENAPIKNLEHFSNYMARYLILAFANGALGAGLVKGLETLLTN